MKSVKYAGVSWMDMTDDIYCTKLEEWREDGKILFENKHAFAILSVTPAVPGHFTTVPKRHVTDETELTGEELVGLFAALKEALRVVSNMDAGELRKFYADLKENPPIPASADMADKMLAHPYLDKKVLAYNFGINRGKEAGQIIDHIHIHVFPIRKAGKGVVSAMRRLHEA